MAAAAILDLKISIVSRQFLNYRRLIYVCAKNGTCITIFKLTVVAFDKFVEKMHLGALPKILKIWHHWLLYSKFLHLAFKISIRIYYHLPAFAHNAIL